MGKPSRCFELLASATHLAASLTLYLPKEHIYPSSLCRACGFPVPFLHSQGRWPSCRTHWRGPTSIQPLLASSPTPPFILVWAMLSQLESQQASLLLHAPHSTSFSEALASKTEAKKRLVVFSYLPNYLAADWIVESFGEKKDKKLVNISKYYPNESSHCGNPSCHILFGIFLTWLVFCPPS